MNTVSVLYVLLSLWLIVGGGIAFLLIGLMNIPPDRLTTLLKNANVDKILIDGCLEAKEKWKREGLLTKLLKAFLWVVISPMVALLFIALSVSASISKAIKK